MIFAGDVAIARGDVFQFSGFAPSTLKKPWCVNLEGAVATDDAALPSFGVYNSDAWIASFASFKIDAVFLGNNHICDIPDGIRSTLAILKNDGLVGFGAGLDTDGANCTVTADSGAHTYRLLGFGWPVIGCQPAGDRRPGVNPLEGGHVLACAATAVQSGGADRVVVVMHGNYEFERYPQPGHRKLSRMLIDLGVYAVIWHHPHIVGPVERYKGRTIAYSLGNWAFSYGRFFDGRLRFPESSFHQIAVELGEDGDCVHHARFAPPATVTWQHSERVDAADFSLRPVFEGYSDATYLRWFKANRVKRKGLPIYRDAMDSLPNRLRDRWVWLRQVLIDAAAKRGLKAMRKSC